MKTFQDLEETLKHLLKQAVEPCPACGCLLWNRKKFFKECFNCSYEEWFSLSTPGVREKNKEDDNHEVTVARQKPN